MESVVVVVETHQADCLVLLAPCRSYSQFCIEGTHDACLVDTSTQSQVPLFRLPACCTDVVLETGKTRRERGNFSDRELFGCDLSDLG